MNECPYCRVKAHANVPRTYKAKADDGKNIRMVSHIDGRDFYGYTYNCECGNVITSKTKRAKGDMML